MNDMAKTI